MLSKVSQTPAQSRSYTSCTPPAKNDAATVVTAPAASGLGACINSNLDLSRVRIVKSSLTVSITGGFHYRVIRVRLGYCWCSPLDAFGHVNRAVVHRFNCSVVRVVV